MFPFHPEPTLGTVLFWRRYFLENFCIPPPTIAMFYNWRYAFNVDNTSANTGKNTPQSILSSSVETYISTCRIGEWLHHSSACGMIALTFFNIVLAPISAFFNIYLLLKTGRPIVSAIMSEVENAPASTLELILYPSIIMPTTTSRNISGSYTLIFAV